MNFLANRSTSKAIVGAMLLLLAAVSKAATEPGARENRAALPQTFASLPLFFEKSQGQSPSEARFLARGCGCAFDVTPWGARMFFTQPETGPRNPRTTLAQATQTAGQTKVIEMRFIGAQPAPGMAGLGELPGRVNYFLGNDPAQWQTGVQLYQRVRLDSVYPGVDAVFYGSNQQLEYDLVLKPKADPAQIIIEFSGADAVSIEANGDLILHVGREEIRQHRPVLHQTVRGQRREITGGYRRLATNQIGFGVGDYDRDLELVIDPVVNYATYFGGTGLDVAWQIAVDATGAAYIAGETTSAGLVASAGAFQTNFAGGTTNGGDVFVAKLNPDGSGLEYLTYLGGRGSDGALALALDAAGNVYLTGYTASTNYPTANALNPKISGKVDKVTGFPLSDAFVTKLNTNGSQLLYSTYLGGTSSDEGLGIAVDSLGNAFVTGFSDSEDFPTANALQSLPGGGRDGFVAALNPAGSAYLFSTYLGGANTDLAVGVAVDPSGAACVCGYTFSTNFPVTNAFQAQLNMTTNDLGLSDAFLLRLAPGGTQLVYSTFLGGEGNDFAYRVASDAAGNAYLAGWGNSSQFPASDTNTTMFLVQTNAATNSFSGMDSFIVKVVPSGMVTRKARFGGTGDDQAMDIKLDAAGNLHVAGFTTSPQVPVIGATHPENQSSAGFNDAFVFALSPDFSSLRYSLMFGGSVDDFGFGVALDAAGIAYVVGRTGSVDFPIKGGLQRLFGGGISDAFVARVLLDPALTVQATVGNLVVSWPAPAPDFVLQLSHQLPDGPWLTLLPQPVLTNGVFFLTLPTTSEPTFLRLFHP